MGHLGGHESVVEVMPPADESLVSKSMLERQEKRAEALRVVQAISSLAGKEIPILATPDAASIPQEPGVYIFPDYDDPDNPITDTVYENDPKLLSGRADSAHSVLTGHLISRTKSGELRTIAVAAKCSLKRTPDERFARAINELGIMSDLYQRGELGFKPIALAIAPDHAPMGGKLVMISRFDLAINTMDNLPWGRGISDANNVEDAIGAADALGRFNAVLGYQHNDAKIKNCATSPVQKGFIDFENTARIDPSLPGDAAGAANKDFNFLIDSLAGKGFFHHPKAKEVLRRMADAYLEHWAGASSAVFDPVYSMVEEAIERPMEKRLKHPGERKA